MSEEKGGRGLGRGEKAGKGGEGWEGGGKCVFMASPCAPTAVFSH